MRNPMLLWLLMPVVCGGCAAAARSAPAIDPRRVVDLSYSLGPDTIYWPTAQPFKMQRVAWGRTPGGYFYYANNI